MAEICNFCHFCAQNEWEIVRWWHHQLAHLHIHTNWSRNVSWKFAKLQSVITFLFFNQFSSGFHCFIHKFLLFLMKLSLNLFRISPLNSKMLYMPIQMMCVAVSLKHVIARAYFYTFAVCVNGGKWTVWHELSRSYRFLPDVTKNYSLISHACWYAMFRMRYAYKANDYTNWIWFDFISAFFKTTT